MRRAVHAGSDDDDDDDGCTCQERYQLAKIHQSGALLGFRREELLLDEYDLDYDHWLGEFEDGEVVRRVFV